MNYNIVDKYIKLALEEDLGQQGDITTDAIFSDDSQSVAKIIFKENGIIAGLNFLKRVFAILDREITIKSFVNEGDYIEKGMIVAKIKGNTKNILKGERLALNILQRVSGIATNTSKYVNEIKGFDTQVVDTRKTTPNFRIFEKYGVLVGGGKNHRFGLYDMVMIKDNHISAAGGIKKAVEKIKKNVSHSTKIEVEINNIYEAQEALDSNVDIVMIDNLKGKKLSECIKLLKGKVIIEASGNINLKNIKEFASSGVEIISSGSIIYTANPIDISIKITQ